MTKTEQKKTRTRGPNKVQMNTAMRAALVAMLDRIVCDTKEADQTVFTKEAEDWLADNEELVQEAVSLHQKKNGREARKIAALEARAAKLKEELGRIEAEREGLSA